MNILLYLILLQFGYAFVRTQNKKTKLKIQDNNIDTDIINGIGIIIMSLPTLMRQGGNCKNDDDCPFIMRCCKLGINNYCCSPNNFVSVDLAYIEQFISTNTTSKKSN